MMTPDMIGDVEPLWIDDVYIYPTMQFGRYEVCRRHYDEHIEVIGVYAAFDLVPAIQQAITRKLRPSEIENIYKETQMTPTATAEDRGCHSGSEQM